MGKFKATDKQVGTWYTILRDNSFVFILNIFVNLGDLCHGLYVVPNTIYEFV